MLRNMSGNVRCRVLSQVRRLLRFTSTLGFLGVLVLLSTVLAPQTVAAHGTHSPIQLLFINGYDYGYHMPSRVRPGMTEIVFTNSGDEEHMAQLIRMKPGKSEKQVLNAFGALFSPAAQQNPSVEARDMRHLLAIASAAGGANGILPHSNQHVFVNLTPGRYVVLCLEATGGVAHFAKGMYHSLLVTWKAPQLRDSDDPTWGSQPASAGTITEVNHSIYMPKVIHYSRQMVLRVNVYSQTHELQLQRVPAGTTRQQYLQCLTGPQNACQLKGMPIDWGGTGALAPGSSQWVELNLPRGTYAALCFVPDIHTGMPHAFMGMVTVFVVM